MGDAARQPPAPDSAATRMDPEPIIAPTAILRNKAEVDAMAKKYGLDVAMADPVERALSAEMYARAERILANHPIDEKRLRPLLSAVGMEATSTRMLLSKNPLMRATAVMLMENPEGAAGRQVSAALISTVRERAYRSVMEPEYDSLLEMFAAGQGKGRIRSFLDPRIKEEFNNALSREMHSRWMEQGPTTDNQAVLRMADVLDEGYRMMGAEFKQLALWVHPVCRWASLGSSP